MTWVNQVHHLMNTGNQNESINERVSKDGQLGCDPSLGQAMMGMQGGRQDTPVANTVPHA
jgi:hypothetical protein